MDFSYYALVGAPNCGKTVLFNGLTGSNAFAKPPDVDAVQGVAAQRVQTYHIDRQASEQRTTQKCAADGGFAKVSA